MKKLLLLSFVALSLTGKAISQEAETIYNKWSVDFGAGMHIASRPYAPNYQGNDVSLYQGFIGVRHMFNDKFGIRGVFGYNNIQENDDTTPFEAGYFRGTIEGVVNVGNILRFSDFSNRLGLLLHTGAGYSNLDAKAPIDDSTQDEAVNLTLGLTPQIRITNRFAFNIDVTLIGHVGFNDTWDGTQEIVSTNRTIDDGLLYNFSAGFSYYLGGNEKHMDWAVIDNSADLKDKIQELEERLAKVETDLIDTDQDGVADYLDREQNTVSGVAVNTKGIAIDQNKNGIPDELESSLDSRYVNKNEYTKGNNINTSNEVIKSLLNKGYVNVYFKTNSTNPQMYSLDAINYIKVYMNENPSATAQLIGYTDEIGNATNNISLSEKRAKKVYDILVASGVSADRLSHSGNGEDTSVDKRSKEARQLVRRVTFKLN
jgi:OOP family OmpA-OmpF porin